MERDLTDRLLEGSSRASGGELEMEPALVAERIGRIALHLSRWQDEVFGRFGLNRGEVGVLYALLGVGPPHRLSPTQLSRMLMLSSAGVTGRLDRLERRGLLARLPDHQDRRGVLVDLTEPGARLAEEAVRAGVEAQAQVMSGLTHEDLETLSGLLRKLQAGLEPAAGPRLRTAPDGGGSKTAPTRAGA